MNERKLRMLMVILVVIGIILVLIGVSLIIFTDITITKGTDGILTIAGFIAGGLFLSVPAKIYLTLQMMKYNDEKLRARNTHSNEN